MHSFKSILKAIATNYLLLRVKSSLFIIPNFITRFSYPELRLFSPYIPESSSRFFVVENSLSTPEFSL